MSAINPNDLVFQRGKKCASCGRVFVYSVTAVSVSFLTLRCIACGHSGKLDRVHLPKYTISPPITITPGMKFAYNHFPGHAWTVTRLGKDGSRVWGKGLHTTKMETFDHHYNLVAAVLGLIRRITYLNQEPIPF